MKLIYQAATVAFVGLFALPTTGFALEKKVTIDTQKSVLHWTGRKLTGQHHGRVSLKSGEVILGENNQLLGGNFVVDLTSMKNDDLTDKEYNAKLVNHLKSDDFFNVEQHSTAVFKITKAEPIVNAPAGKPNHNITGDLTILGATHPITFPAIVSVTGDKAAATATVTVDRTVWNIRYGSGKFFASLGDKLIYDDFTVDLSVSGNV